MSAVLVRIKRAVLSGRYVFSEKARLEMEADNLTGLDVAESILNAVAIYKRIRGVHFVNGKENTFTLYRVRTQRE